MCLRNRCEIEDVDFFRREVDNADEVDCYDIEDIDVDNADEVDDNMVVAERRPTQAPIPRGRESRLHPDFIAAHEENTFCRWTEVLFNGPCSPLDVSVEHAVRVTAAGGSPNDAIDAAVCAARRYHDDRRKKHNATHGDDESEDELAVQDDMQRRDKRFKKTLTTFDNYICDYGMWD